MPLLVDLTLDNALDWAATRGIRVLLVAAAALITQHALRRIVPRVLTHAVLREATPQTELDLRKRADTLSSVIVHSAGIALLLIGLFMALDELGFNVAPFLAGLGIGQTVTAPRVVFVCTANSARSQLAVALWNRASSVPAASGGTHPAERIAPAAVETARDHGLSIGDRRPQSLDDIRRPDDVIITVCDNAHEELGAPDALDPVLELKLLLQHGGNREDPGPRLSENAKQGVVLELTHEEGTNVPLLEPLVEIAPDVRVVGGE